MKPGARNLITDVKGLGVGHASDTALKSGTTVLTGDKPFVASVHVMGGAPGTRETDLLAPDKTVSAIDALVLSGGSAFGLDAAGGVMSAMKADGRGYPVGDVIVPIVPGAIIFDLLSGGDHGWSSSPYPALGEAAYRAASVDFALGSHGVGTGAATGMHKGGLGSASAVLASGVTVGALIAANAVGSVTTPGETHFWAAPFEQGDEFGGRGVDPADALGGLNMTRKMQLLADAHPERSNTTIGIVATDASLTKAQCHRLAVAAHDGIARAVMPAHTPFDGDLLFAVSTGLGPQVDDATLFEIGHAASLCVARSIARAVYHATPAPGDRMPCWPG